MSGTVHELDSTPLIVDLDGTLIATDSLWEGCALYLMERPFEIWRLLAWLLRGRTVLKHSLAARVSLNPAELPYRPEVLRLIESAKTQGRRVILATASPRPWAEAIASHLGVFDKVLATDSANLKGQTKLEAIRNTLGAVQFDYAGDSSADMPLFEQARRVYYCGSRSGRVQRKLSKLRPDAAALGDDRGQLREWARQLRLRQWVKNTLLAVPFIAGGRPVTADAAASLLLGFFGFSFCASAIYCINDLLDLRHDRKHPRKKARPLAGGRIHPASVVAASGALLAAGLGISMLLPWTFAGLIAIYCCLSLAYVVRLKRMASLDVFSLAALYTLRLFAGAFVFVPPIELSTWLLAFSAFLFSSLALAKRAAEMILTLKHPTSLLSGRGYAAQDLETIRTLGIACGVVAVLVLALYVEGATAARVYAHPRLLLLLCLPLLAWVGRLWIQLGRGELADDPMVFVIEDRGSWLLLAVSVVIYAAARLLPSTHG